MREGAPKSRVDEIYIPGGFDLLHPDHKSFVERCVEHARNVVDFDSVVIGLVSDAELNLRSTHRPFFSFEWRKEDMERWWKNNNNNLSLSVVLDQQSIDYQGDLRRNRGRLVVASEEQRGSAKATAAVDLYGGIIFVSPLNTLHTSDIESSLTSERSSSYCKRPVGAVLLRDGIVQATFRNGGGPDSCDSCSKYLEVMRVFEDTGNMLPTSVACDYQHAEARCLELADKGDYLLTTTSPCNDCAEFIFERGVQRVVYLEGYHDQKPLDYLKQQGVEVRRAGI